MTSWGSHFRQWRAVSLGPNDGGQRVRPIFFCPPFIASGGRTNVAIIFAWLGEMGVPSGNFCFLKYASNSAFLGGFLP